MARLMEEGALQVNVGLPMRRRTWNGAAVRFDHRPAFPMHGNAGTCGHTPLIPASAAFSKAQAAFNDALTFLF
jgi:hypothetical protein